MKKFVLAVMIFCILLSAGLPASAKCYTTHSVDPVRLESEGGYRLVVTTTCGDKRFFNSRLYVTREDALQDLKRIREEAALPKWVAVLVGLVLLVGGVFMTRLFLKDYRQGRL
jgi:hypothetical protein